LKEQHNPFEGIYVQLKMEECKTLALGFVLLRVEAAVEGEE